MTLQDKLDEFKAGVLKRIPAEVFARMQAATDDLIASGQARRALTVGDRAPEFSLPDADGAIVNARDLLAHGPLVISFYRGVWCPYCNMEMKALQAELANIRASGAQLVAISPQTAANARKAQRDNGLDFPVLMDRGNEVAAAFGIRFKLSDELAGIYKNKLNNDLAVANGEPSWTLPMPGRFVIAQDGVVAYAEVNPDYTRRPDPSELLPVLRHLGRAAAAE